MKPLSTPGHIAGKQLLEFQQAGLEFLKSRSRALLYDEAGVGKTLQGVAWSVADPTVLVSAPKPILEQWADYYRTEHRDVVIRPSVLAPGQIGIANPEALSKVSVSAPFTLVVDECHMFKNLKTARSKVLLGLSDRASKVLAISATPTLNRPIELWSIYLMMQERLPKEFWHWAMRYTGAYQTDFGWDFTGATHLDELREDMLHFSIRRELAEVMPELPPIRREDLKVELAKGEDAGTQEAASRVQSLLAAGNGGEAATQLQVLRQRLSLAKVGAAVEWIRAAFDGGSGPIVCFTGFIESANQLASAFGTVAIHSETADDKRLQVLQRFSVGDDKLLVCTIGSAGTGLDGLQQVSQLAVSLDLPWTPGELEQLEGRLQRRGQLGSVNFVTLLSGAYIETKMLEALRHKKDVISYLMEVV